MRLARFALPALTPFALALAGCSDPTAQAAAGAITMSVIEPDTGQICGLSHNSVIPADASIGPSGPGGQRVVNGQRGASVSCQLRGETFSARIEQITSMGTQNVSITGTLADGQQGSAKMTNFTSQTAQTLSSPTGTPCVLQPSEVSRERVFARFECEQLINPPSNFCEATGYFVFDNCE